MSDVLLPPRAKTQAHKVVSHGEIRVDPYSWLRDKPRPEVRAYLEAENAYTAAMLKDTEVWQQRLYEEMIGRIQETDRTAPVRLGEYFYYSRTEKGRQYSIRCRQRGEDGAEEILLDGNVLAEGHEYFSVGGFTVSQDQKLLAYSIDTTGDEEYTVFVKDLATGTLLDDRIGKIADTLVWAEDGRTLFYTLMDEARRPFKLLRHRLGTAVSEDVEVWHETDQRFIVALEKTRSRRFLLLVLDSQTATEIRYLDAARPEGEWHVLVPRRQDVEASAAHHGERFFVRVSDTGKTFRLVEAPVSDPRVENWRELLPARLEITIEDVDAYASHLVREERQDGLRRVRIRHLSTGEEHEVAMPEPVYTVHAGLGLEFETSVLRLKYSSLVTPPADVDYDMETREWRVVKQETVLGGYDPSQYVTERIWATAPDAVRVPVSVVRRKDTPRDGSAPALLYGYGAYGLTSEPEFRAERVSLLDRGFVYAIAHIRGGGDLGKLWHEAGRMKNKPNSFADFIAAAETLIAERYTTAPRLAIQGRSAGGLLIGAVLNMRPELFGAALASVPFVDVLNTMEDASLPLTVGEYEEWGNPAEEEFYRLIRSYSPYDNVAARAYPALLVTAGLNDPRVSYWEPAKWVAKLRALGNGHRPLLLKVNLGAGHFGVSGRYEKFKETALEYAFLLKVLGGRAHGSN
jgi:oligopeptidase B